jgi:predicted MFS family arabinose efflux permease
LLALAASGAADGFLPVALSFAVLRVTASTSRLGLVLATQAIVALLVTLAGGLAGDRFPRRRVLAISLLARMIAAGVLATALLAGTPPFALLLAMAAVHGGADGFFGPAAAALLPEVVSPAQLTAANAVVGGTSSAGSIAAPAAAGLLVAAAGPGAALAVQAGLLAAAAACLAVARTGAGPAAPAPRPGPVRRLAEGFAAFMRLRWLWLLTAEWTCFSLIVLAPLAVLGPAISQQDLGGAPAWGLISSALAAGAVGGQIAAGRLPRPARPALVIAALVPVMTAEALALGLGAPLAVIIAAAAVAGLAMGAQAVLFPVAMQTAVPSGLLARVAAIDLLASEAGQPAGYALAGPAAAAIGAHAVLAAGAAGLLAAGAAFAWLRPLRVPAGRP